MFVHLDCHSHYSFLRAVPSPQEIIAAAMEASMPAVALTDTNGMYAAIPFYKEALARGIKPIVGVKLDVEWPSKEDARGKRENRSEIPSFRVDKTLQSSSRNDKLCYQQIVLLAENAEG